MSDDYVTVNVQGLSELQTALEELPVKIAKRGLRQALRAGGNVIKAAMVARAPRLSGFLAAHFNVTTRLQRDELAGTAFIGPNNRAVYPKGKPNWPARTAAMVARWLEFGTSRTSKQPFMTQAAETTQAAVVDAVAEKLKDALDL